MSRRVRLGGGGAPARRRRRPRTRARAPDRDHDRHGIIRVVPLRSRKTFVLVVLVLLFIVVGAVSYVGWRQSVRPPSVTSAAPRMLGHKTTVPMTLEAAHGNVAGVEIRVVQGTKQAVVLKQDGNLGPRVVLPATIEIANAGLREGPATIEV